YAITPKQDRKSMIVKLDTTQVTSLLLLDDGTLMAGSANKAKIIKIGKGFADKGTLTSKPLDAGQIVKWGRIKWDAVVPTGAKLTVATRSGNVSDEESNAWEEWSDEMDATTAQQIMSPGARFLQYRFTFTSSKADATAKLTRVNIPYIEENRPPVISGLEVVAAAVEAKKPSSSSKVKQLVGASGYGGGRGSDDGDGEMLVPHIHNVIKWSAEDPNQDTLMYNVYFRAVGSNRWIRLAKDLKETMHIWDTRTVPDGKYEVRVVADDRLSNSPATALQDARISDPFLVDNTPPEVRVERVEMVGKRGARLYCRAIDELSPIAEASYRVNGEEEPKTIMADDDIFDSLEETFTITLDDLDAGDHWISIRVSDDQGNARFITHQLTVGE
ncbi:MAG: fibronectin type III domain-containing protein, partial [Phycisphaerae bacterium]|nr:fibronectin type III domain-containing protein [Phycisphaerae bacterium]